MTLRSFFAKMLLGNLLVIGAVSAGTGFIAFEKLSEIHLDQRHEHQRQLTSAYARYFEQMWEQFHAQGVIDEHCRSLVSSNAFRITVVASDGKVLGESMGDSLGMSDHLTPDRPEIIAAMRGTPGVDVRTSETLDIEYRYFAMPITRAGVVVGAVRTSISRSDIAHSTSIISNALLWAIVAGVITAGLLAVLLGRVWHRPLRRIVHAARLFADGKLDTTLKPAGCGELAELSVALNDMARRLAEQMNQLQDTKRQLLAVVNNLHDGVMAISPSGQVSMLNDSAREMMNAPVNAVGLGAHEVLRQAQLIQLYERTSSIASSSRCEVELSRGSGRRIIDAHCIRADTDSPGMAVLMVLRDVTDLARASEMKAQFVANASHELRTPLATLRAAVDSLALEPADPSEQDKLISMLDRHVSRLENMTNDLLDLHIVESPSHMLDIRSIRPCDIVERMRGHFQTLAREKGVELTFHMHQADHPIDTDRKLIELVVQNLLDNAVKFTPSGGEVSCDIVSTPQDATITVADNGCGIDEREIARVFERFYQARGSSAGGTRKGTGLGLAIVKHACDRLGARINLKSILGAGTTATVYLPRVNVLSDKHEA